MISNQEDKIISEFLDSIGPWRDTDRHWRWFCTLYLQTLPRQIQN